MAILLFSLTEWTDDSCITHGYLKNHRIQSPAAADLASRTSYKTIETEYYEPFNHFHQALEGLMGLA